jgi:Fe-S cluster assembly protein SufD
LADPKSTLAGRADDVRAVSALLSETPHLSARRDAAYARLGEAKMPSRVEHLWRFTNPENLLPETLSPVAGSVAAPATGGNAATVVLSPGSAPRIEITDAAVSAGLVVAPLADGPDGAERLGEAAGDDAFFTTVNDAAWNTGLMIRAPRGASFDGPVHVIVHASGAVAAPRLLLVAEENAEVVLVEEHRGGGDDTRVVGVTEVLAGPAARVRHVVVQTWNGAVHGHLGVHARADRDADVKTAFCGLGARRAKLELVTTLAGAGSRSEMTGVTLASDRQHLDMHTRHVHEAGRTTSDIDFKSVAADRARNSYTGLIRIETDAREVEAFQENRNLLLSDACRADTIPELEILNQEVSCSHGATVSPIDEDQVFYLESRGIPRNRARRLIVRGFLEKTLVRLPDALRARVEETVDARLDQWEGSDS